MARPQGVRSLTKLNKQPTQEQLKRFCEWCGFKFIKDKYGWGRDTWISPLGECLLELPEPDLNNLFRYAVPQFAIKFGITKTRELLHRWINEAYMSLPEAKDLMLAIMNEQELREKILGKDWHEFGSRWYHATTIDNRFYVDGHDWSALIKKAGWVKLEEGDRVICKAAWGLLSPVIKEGLESQKLKAGWRKVEGVK